MYSKLFEINKNFQSSVNLDLDLDNESKIYEYVPTNDICDVLKKYVKCALGKTNNKATTLVGPYGKGKSFLLLVLSYIFSKNKNSKCWNVLVQKIKKIDKELYDLMMELKKKNISLLTVVINSNYENLDQSFMVALSDSLKRCGADTIVPNNAFTIALETLSKWKNNPDFSSDLQNICENKSNSTLDEIEKGLRQYSSKYYSKFCDIYYCIHKGATFNPLVNGDIVKVYSDVACQLHLFGYAGMFILFDEFSKFIESSTSDLSKGLKLVQDLAEKCTRTGKNGQLHLCCVTHKNLSLYKGNEKNSFKAVEGRFVEIKFNRSLEENYQIISAAIKKKTGAEKLAKRFVYENNDFYQKVTELGIFSENTALYSDLFPLNPLTAYALIQLSELVAQNERTLYTFLSDTDVNSFNFFIHNNEAGLFNVDKIYDYFSDLLQKEETNFIRNLWYRSESISSKLESSLEKRVIKTLAIILMINDYDKLPPNEEVISVCLNEPLEKVALVVKKLFDSHCLRKNILNNLLSFALSNTKYIDGKIAVLSKTKFRFFDEAEISNKLNEKRYLIPRRHNEERKITRFFKVIYINEKEFISLTNFDIFFEKFYCDGIVLNLLRHTLSDNQIKEKINAINNDRVILCYPKIKIDPVFNEELLRYVCLKDIEVESSLDDISKEEVDLLIEEASEDIRGLLNEYFEHDVIFVNSKYSEKMLPSLLSTILDNCFYKKLIFNNELVNKRALSKQYQKAVNNIVDSILNGEEDNFGPTSPEASTKRSILTNNKDNQVFREVIDSIKSRILSLEGKKENFSSLFSYLEQPPYGIRKGVLPILIAESISELSNDRNNILIYFDKKEIMLNADNLVKAIGKDAYYLASSKGSSGQKDYLDKMLRLFNVTPANSHRMDTYSLANAIRKYFMGLPSVVRACNFNDFLMLGTQFIQIKNLFLEISINPYDAIFAKPCKILNTKNYSDIIEFFSEIPSMVENALKQYKTNIIDSVKTVFETEKQESLKTGLTRFVNNSLLNNEKLILSDEDKKVEDVIENKLNYDDYQTIEELSEIYIGSQIEDWEKDNHEQLEDCLANFKKSVVNADRVDLSAEGIDKMFDDDNLQLDGIAALLSNNVESVIEEFSDSVSNADKVKILTKILKKYL